MKNLVIAVDGPAGAGKSTIAKLIAEKLNINYIFQYGKWAFELISFLIHFFHFRIFLLILFPHSYFQYI